MNNWLNKLNRFWHAEDGPTAVEYAIVLALILGGCISAASTFGVDLGNIFHHDSQSVESAVDSTPAGS